MKKLVSILIIFTFVLQVFAQDTLVEKRASAYTIVELEQLRAEAIIAGSNNLADNYARMIKEQTEPVTLELSKVSLGTAVYSIVDLDNPDYTPPDRSPAAGFGLEFNLNYYLSKNFNVSGFVRISGINNVFLTRGGGSETIAEKAIDYSATLGGLFEYRFFNWFGFDIKAGIEKLTNYPKKASSIYGGGLSFYLNSLDRSRLQQSFRIGVYKSNNQTGVKFNPYPSSELYYGDAIIYELGYRIQFRKVR